MKASKYSEYVVILAVLGLAVAGTALSLPWYEIKTLTGPGGEVTATDTYYVQYTDQSGVYNNDPTGPENSIELLLWTWLIVAIVFVGSVVLNERPLGLITGLIACALSGAALFLFTPLFARYYQIPHFIFEGTTSYGAYVQAGPTIGYWWSIAGFAFMVTAFIIRVFGLAKSEPEE